MDITQILETIDKLYEENRALEAELLLKNELAEARYVGDGGKALQLLNELIGYYRSVSKSDKLVSSIVDAIQLAKSMGLQGTIPYATTVINAANGYRSIGQLDKARILYKEAEGIYNTSNNVEPMQKAGLYNNFSLYYQEVKDYDAAERYLLKALEIAEDNSAWFEVAVTYANLANTAIAKMDIVKAKSYSKKSTDIFEAHGLYDAHYSAAISALGMSFYYEKDFDNAESIFIRGMEIVEKSLGRNSQYERLAENLAEVRNAKMSAGIKGLELCEAYYNEIAKPSLEAEFGEYVDRIAVGLVGEGSDCFGFDDNISMDHDWGPSLCIWLTDDLYDRIGDRLTEWYRNLPKEYKGYKTNTVNGSGRRGVMKISDFYRKIIGAASISDISWTDVQDYALAAATNGKVFADPVGEFSKIRNDLIEAGYPGIVRYLRLMDAAANYSQTAQYNYFRMAERGDMITANSMIYDAIKHAIRLQHYICNVFPPHDKWLRKSLLDLENGKALDEMFEKLVEAISLPYDEAEAMVRDITDGIGSLLANELYSLNIISDIDPYIEHHKDEILQKGIMSISDSSKLVDDIVKLEFNAFDLVKNEGGRASCQNDWPTFSIMRKSQYMTWSKDMLMQYLYDFRREFAVGHNLITEKYGRMMESTAPEKYAEIKHHFPKLSDKKKQIIEQIVSIQMDMMEKFALTHPKVAGNARSLHTYEDNIVNTSYETYLRGEISTYSDKMLQLYAQFVIDSAKEGKNIARMTIENTAKLYGYKDIDEMEKWAR